MSYKIKITVWLLSFVVIAATCSKVPRKYIQPDEMKVMMWEMMFADKKIFGNGGSIMSYPDSLTTEYSKVLEYHGVSQKKFIDSWKYYQSNPELLKVLYDSVYNYGNRMVAQVQERIRIQDSIKGAEARLQDSLNLSKPDSLKRDSLRRDSIRIDSLKKDSISKVLPAITDSFNKNLIQAI